MSGHRIRIPPDALIRIDGVGYRLASVIATGWVLEVVDRPGITRAITVAAFEREAAKPGFQLDPHGCRPGAAKAREESGADDLSHVPRKEWPAVLSRLAWVKHFRALEAAGEASRSNEGMDRAAARVVERLERERVEGNDRIMAAKACAGSSSEAPKRRERRERHDARTVQGVREKPVKAICGRTLLRWTLMYEKGGCTAVSLRPGYHLCGNRGERFQPEVMALLAGAARNYASLQRPTRAACLRDLRGAVRALNARRVGQGGEPVRCPAKAALEAEIARLGKFQVHAARHGAKKAWEKFGPYRTGHDVTRAGQLIQMDEWEVGAFTLLDRAGIWEALDEPSREIALRHRLMACVAFDVVSRACLGVTFSLNQNTIESAIACLAMIVTDKTPLARWAGATSSWSMACTPESILTDGGPGFASEEFRASEVALTGDSDVAAGGEPEHRAHIERFFRTAEWQLSPLLPARAFSNPVDRGDYDSVGQTAVLDTLLKKLFIIWVCDVYHQSPHAGIKGCPPAAKWDTLVGECAPIPTRGSELRRNALGVELSRKSGRHGVRVLGLHYASETLHDHFKKRGPEDVPVRVDPIDLGRVSVRLPDGWHACPCVQGGMEGTSMQVWVETEADLRRRHAALARLSEATVLDAIQRMKAMVADAVPGFGLGGPRPSPGEIDRLSGRMRIAFLPRRSPGGPASRDLRDRAIPAGTPADGGDYAVMGPEHGGSGDDRDEAGHGTVPDGVAPGTNGPDAAAVGEPGGGPAGRTTDGRVEPAATVEAARPAGADEDEDDGDDDYRYDILDRDDGR